ncbi:hypothetical protein AAC387_Pa05g1820 [Persea americana]
MNSDGGKDKATFNPDKHIEDHLPVRVKKQRLSNLLQSLLVGACIAAMPAIKLISTSVLWGYFAYMAVDSLPGTFRWRREQYMEVCDAEIMDEHTTHRGELKLRTASTFSDDRRYQKTEAIRSCTSLSRRRTGKSEGSRGGSKTAERKWHNDVANIYWRGCKKMKDARMRR